MTRMTGPDCAVICNLINMHTYIHTYIHAYIHTYITYIFSSRPFIAVILVCITSDNVVTGPTCMKVFGVER